MQLEFDLSSIVIFLLVSLSAIWFLRKKVNDQNHLKLFFTNTSYPIKSSISFAGFQIILIPLMILVSLFNSSFSIFQQIISIQSLFILSLYNFLIFGERVVAIFPIWFLVGIPLHAVGGWIIGHLLQTRLSNLKFWQKILISLIIFEFCLTSMMFLIMNSNVWINIWKLPSEW